MSESVKSTVFGIKRSSLSKIIDFTSTMRRFYGFVLSVIKVVEQKLFVLTEGIFSALSKKANSQKN
jgi:hypothetical protein